ncbi:MAG: alanine--tRNA ligase [Candidatus Hydrothermarchaeaceae archaeon]
MQSESELKKQFRIRAQKDPEKYYPVEILKEEGFSRKRCSNCGNFFWSVGDRDVCGEPVCSGGYTFIGDSPAGERMDFIKTWQRFASIFEKLGYTPIARYPVVARWRDDTDFVQASIYDFQPHCVSGETDPPANPLVVPQFCLRFNDTDNVGITGRHYTGFVMIGQHAFESPKNYKPNDYLSHIYTWLVESMKIPKEELQFHEDAWAGGGNMGPSMEFFSRGLEIGNQVYMQYDIKSGSPKELDIKVLDMGMGQERPAWFTYGTNTSYEAVFPTVVKELLKRTGIRPEHDLINKFLPYSSILNVEESEDIGKAWQEIASSIGEDVSRLKEQALSLAGIYSIGDHSRSLLLALSDGALPSNVGGGYNLRVLVRRAFDIISRYDWDVSLPHVCEVHAKYLKPQYPELMENLDEVGEILDIEMRKYRDTKKKSKRIVATLSGGVSLEKLIELYDSRGISPEMLKGAGLDIEIPADFYNRVSEMHEKRVEEAREDQKEFDLNDIGKTEILYYDDYTLIEFTGKVEKIFENKYVVLDRTVFYPTSGGQLTDTGYMNGCRVTDVFKQGSVILHTVESLTFKEGDEVSCKIDRERRKQLAQHHTATHIINGVAKQLLGEHIWQAGAEKTLDKSRLDITHYEGLTQKERTKIQEMANKIVEQDIPVESAIYRRDVAEREFGFRLYQGGAVPGKELRVVKIGDLDVEACGGTHLKRTGEAEHIEVIGSTKIQDGVVRLEYVAGRASDKYQSDTGDLFDRIVQHLKQDGWTIKEEKKFDKKMAELTASAKTFSISIDQLPATIERFSREIKEYQGEIGRLSKSLDRTPKLKEIKKSKQSLSKFGSKLFENWKSQKKEIEKLQKAIAKQAVEKIGKAEKVGKHELLIGEIDGGMDEAIKTAGNVLAPNRGVVIFGKNKDISVVGMKGEEVDIDMGAIVKEICGILEGGGGGRPDFGRGSGDKEKLQEAMEFAKSELKKALS